MINDVAELARLTTPEPAPTNRVIQPLTQRDLPELVALVPESFTNVDGQVLEQFDWHNPFVDCPVSLFALKEAQERQGRRCLQRQGTFPILSRRLADN